MAYGAAKVSSFGRVTLTRHKGNRNTVLVQDYAPFSLGHNVVTGGFSVFMPDGSELSVRLDRKLVASLARHMKITPGEIEGKE